MSLPDDSPFFPQVIELSVRSHLTFSDRSEPTSDSAVREMASQFGDRFGALLKERTGATTVRVADYDGRRSESGETDVVLLIYYFSLQTAIHWHQLYTQFHPVAEMWADEAWHRQLGGHLLRSENQVRVRGHGLSPAPQRGAADAARTVNPVLPVARAGLFIATGVVSALLTLGTVWLATRQDGGTVGDDELTRRIEALEVELARQPIQIDQTVTVGIPAPAAPRATSAVRTERQSRRFTSEGFAE